MKSKAKEFQSRIENTMAKRVELLESINSMEGQLLKKRNDLSSVLESSQIKTMAMERYKYLPILCRNDLIIEFFVLFFVQ